MDLITRLNTPTGGLEGAKQGVACSSACSGGGFRSGNVGVTLPPKLRKKVLEVMMGEQAHPRDVV